LTKFRLDHRLLENFSWPLLGSMLVLCVCGLINLYSVSASTDFGGDWSWFARQSVFLGLSLVGLGLSLFLDYQYLKKIIWPVYGLSLISLAAVLVIGTKINGATRWLDVGLFRFQPSEFVKVVVVVALAAWFAKRDLSAGLGLTDLFIPGLIIMAPFVLIHKQPDLGTAIHLFALSLPIFLVFRFRSHLLLALTLILALVVGLAAFLQFTDSWHLLQKNGLIKKHQLQRVEAYLYPERDPSGNGWQVVQSENAIGGGQVMGRGFMAGPQHKNGFLPEAETDFAFAALSEEWGFVGSILVLALFAFLLISALAVARRSQDRFGSLIALGLTSFLFWQVVINVGMVTGLLPVVGIPLPFISYGGTSLVVTVASVGLILNIGMRRYLFQDEPVRENPFVWRQEPELAAETGLATTPIRRLAADTPFNPEIHPQHRLPHLRPWAKHLRKSKHRSLGHWRLDDTL
jgi:rod shape determining protein RodA